MPTSTTIIVGVDTSPASAHALRWAVREGVLRGWPVRAVLAWSLFDQATVRPEAPFDPSYGENDAKRELEHFLTSTLEDDAEAIERTVVCDLPARALLDAARPGDVLVVGARGLGGFHGLLLGSVSQKCLHQSTGTVAIVRPPSGAGKTSRVERIVVGVDGSNAGNGALKWAVDEARLRGAQLEVVHAWHLPYVIGPSAGVVGFDPAPFEAAARQTATDAVDRVGADDLVHPIKTTVTTDGAAAAVLAAASDADLVVVGTRGAGGFAGLVLGSVSQQVSLHASCPVVLVPPEDQQV